MDNFGYTIGDQVVGMCDSGDVRFGHSYFVTSRTDMNGEMIYGLRPEGDETNRTTIFNSGDALVLLAVKDHYKEEVSNMDDKVNSPAHYTAGGIEVIDFIEAKLDPAELEGYFKGNIIKYVSRSGLKGDNREDLRKAQWYLNRLLGNNVDVPIGTPVPEPEHDPATAPVTKKQRGYIYGLCAKLDLDPRDLPEYIGDDVSETRELTEAEGSQAIGRLLAIREYCKEMPPF